MDSEENTGTARDKDIRYTERRAKQTFDRLHDHCGGCHREGSWTRKGVRVLTVMASAVAVKSAFGVDVQALVTVATIGEITARKNESSSGRL